VLGAIVSIIAGIQSAEAIKCLSGNRDDMSRELVSYDAWSGALTRVEVPRGGGRRRCDACDGLELLYLSGRGSRSTTLCGRNAVQVSPEGRGRISLPDLEARLKPLMPVESSQFMLRFTADDLQVSVFPDGRAIVKGTQDPAIARGVYSRYVGA